MRSVYLQKARIHGQRVKPVHRPAAQIVAANAAQNDRMVAQPACHDGEISHSAAQARSVRHHVPQDFAYA